MRHIENLQARKYIFPLLALAALALVPISKASADTIAWTAPISGITTAGSGANAYVGEVFSVNTDVIVSALGVYQLPISPGVPSSPGSDAYTTSENVTIYNSSGTNVGGRGVTPYQDSWNTSYNVNGYTSDSYYWNLTNILLTPGTYTLVLDTQGSLAPYGSSSTPPTNGWATILGSETASSNSGSGLLSGYNWSNTTPTTSYYGPNMMSTMDFAPEPESLLLFGSGLLGLAGFLRLKRRKN